MSQEIRDSVDTYLPIGIPLTKEQMDAVMKMREVCKRYLDCDGVSPENLHKWYLEAVSNLQKQSFNHNANKPYEKLTQEQQYIDQYIAERINSHRLAGMKKVSNFMELAKDHYWDSLEKDKELIMLHLKAILELMEGKK